MKFRLPALYLRSILVLLLVLGAAVAFSQVAVPQISINMGAGTGKTGSQEQISTSLQILAALTVLSLAPALLILTTSFTRIVIIFGFLRNALGTQNIPPNQVLVGLSLFLTAFVMGPTYQKVDQQALKPFMAKQITFDQAIERGSKPVREFMLRNTYESDLLLFVNIRKEKPQTRDQVNITTLIPAFVISELKTAFIVGFYLFIPFLVIDLIVSSALMSMGMMMLPPTVVSLPAKILVFVLANGWATLVAAIVSGYR